ncbi:MAG: molecular chaperone HtpG [Ignavibacteriales bacterium]|nr:molecular chaperone HtpG [Ignavibacteriales bacterium]
MSEQATGERVAFKAEIKQLLDILARSLYSSREIFLRELISNASDALDKLRFESTRGAEIKDADAPYEITVGFDKDARTITITDTGVGMTKEELISQVGTIAKSGAAEFVKRVEAENGDASSVIGKFGVGFYSVFMVADEAEIVSRSFKPDAKTARWVSDGEGEYEVFELDEDRPRGTTVTLKLKEDAEEFADKERLSGAIKKHSNFISFPIKVEDEHVNTVGALWREPKSSVTSEQYSEFYKFLTYDGDDPLETAHVSVDAPIQFKALLFIPKREYDIFGLNRDDYGLDLYVRRVLIQRQNKELLPEYLAFVKGVVDSEDLPLNISRETLQENVVFNKIAQNVTTHVLKTLEKLAKDDEKKFAEFWREHGRVFKLGYTDYPNREKYAKLLRFNSSKAKDKTELVSLADYVSRMKEDQKEIYYFVGPSREAIDVDPRVEMFKRKDVEVLYLYDPIDELALSSLRTFEEKELKSADQADPAEIEKMPDANDEETTKAEPLSDDDELHFSSLVEKIKKTLGDRVEDVKVSKRLTGSPSCLVNPEGGMSGSMQKILRAANKGMATPKKIFEINKDHALTRNLLAIYKKNENDEFLTETIEQLFDAAQLLEGDLDDPHALVTRLNKTLEKSSGWYKSITEG